MKRVNGEEDIASAIRTRLKILIAIPIH